jgi:hypothetical protein
MAPQHPQLAGMHPQQQQYHQHYHHQHHNSDTTAQQVNAAGIMPGQMPHQQPPYAHMQHQQQYNTATMPRRQSTPPSAMKQNIMKVNPQSLQQQQHPQQYQQQQQHPQQHPQQYPLTKIQTHDSTLATNNKLPPPEASIPNSNAISSEMYERDKQIYKCSTMRQGGKYDAKGQPIYSAKPSILNCPLPEIPKEAGGGGTTMAQPKVDYCHTLR